MTMDCRSFERMQVGSHDVRCTWAARQILKARRRACRIPAGTIENLEYRTLLDGTAFVATDLQPYSGGAGLVMQPSAAPGADVNIPDANLQAAIRAQLGLAADHQITTDDMQALSILEAPNMGIQNLTGLEAATNLTRLNLGQNNVTSVEPLRGLTNLESLYLHGNQITNITPLTGLTKLRELNVGSNPLGSLPPLQGLIGLTALYAYEDQLTSVAPLANLTNLQTLHLANNQLTTVAPLGGLVHLSYLHLSGNRISDVTPLANLTNLATLDLGYNRLTSAAPLQVLTNLTTLHLLNNQLTDVTPLASLTNLVTLGLRRNQLTSVEPLQNLASLRSLDIRYNDLDLSDGSSTMQVIQKLQNQGATVGFLPQNGTPPDTVPTDQRFTVVENAPAGETLGQVAGGSQGGRYSFAFSWGNDEGIFAIDPASGVVSLAKGGALSYGTQPICLLGITATDNSDSGNSTEYTVAVDVVGVFGSVSGRSRKLVFTDRDGDRVTLSLGGGGSAQITGGTNRSITLLNTTGNSVLSISVAKARTGDGIATLSGIQGEGLLRSLSAASVVLNGDLTLDSSNTAAGKRMVAISLAQMHNGSIKTYAEPISTLSLRDWQSDSGTDQLVAPSIRSLAVVGGRPGRASVTFVGNLGASVAVAGSLGTLSVRERLSGNVQANGAVGTVVAGAISGTLTASSFGTIKTRALRGSSTANGDLSGQVHATGDNGRGMAIRTVMVTGNASNSSVLADHGSIAAIRVIGVLQSTRVQTAAGVGAVTVGSLLGSDILVGVASDFSGRFAATSADFANSSAKLGSLTVVGGRLTSTPYTADSQISAPVMGAVRLVNFDAASGPTQVHTLGAAKVSYIDKANRANNWTWTPRSSADSHAVVDIVS